LDPILARLSASSLLSLPMWVTSHPSKLLELCPRGNNKDVIIIILVHDNVYIPC
jgi:hypothetical protein